MRPSPSPDVLAGCGPALVGIARRAIGDRLGLVAAAGDEGPGILREPGASFVTLTLGGRLRGCIGSLEAWRPLADDVAANARAAAFHDPRFAPLDAAEFARVRVEVSVLSASEPMDVRSEADALARLRPGTDGVILRAGSHRATFLASLYGDGTVLDGKSTVLDWFNSLR